MSADLRISELSAASPDMKETEFRALVEDIRAHGQLLPIWTSGGEIIDGRKRWRACQELGLEPKVIDTAAGQAPAAVAYSLNILRTHYTHGQLAMIAAKRATATKAEGPRRRHDRRRRNCGIYPTAKEAAQEAGVSRSAVVHARAVRRQAAPEVTAAVEAGTLTLHSAAQIVKATPKAKQPAVVVKVIAANRGKSRQTPVRGFKRSPKRPLQWRMERGLDQLDNAIEHLGGCLAEPGASQHAGARAWIDQLVAARSDLGKIIRARRKDTP